MQPKSCKSCKISEVKLTEYTEEKDKYKTGGDFENLKIIEKTSYL